MSADQSGGPQHLPVLRDGSQGPEVRRLQGLLNRVANAGLAEDGIFGPRTESAVRQFQASRRLEVDGIVGPKTWAALLGASGAGGAGLMDGRHFGEVASVDPDAPALTIDPAEFLTGEAATRAARADGEIGPGEQLDTDYYIRNVGKDVYRIPVDRNARIEVLEGGHGPATGFVDIHGLAASLHHGRRWYWVTVTGGRVVQLEAQYLP